LLTQVAGRAGRGELSGRVLIQTFYPEHYAIQDAVKQDYGAFFERELHFRRMMAYPPFTSLANVIVRDISWRRPSAGRGSFRNTFRRMTTKGAHPGASDGAVGTFKKRAPVPVLLKSPKRSVLAKLLNGALSFARRRKSPVQPC